MATIQQTNDGCSVSDNLGVLTFYYREEYTNEAAMLKDARQCAGYYTECPRKEVWKYKPAHLSA